MQCSAAKSYNRLNIEPVKNWHDINLEIIRP